MFDVIGENLGVLFGLLVIMWALQFGLTYFQMKKYTKRLKIIRQDGLTSVGMSGGKYKGRTYGILTVNDDNKVIHAEKMAGWTNFSNLRPVPELIGLDLDQILDEGLDLPISNKLLLAFRKAANDLIVAREKGLTKDSTTEDLSKLSESDD
jgi:DNA-binding transcriptional regulator of glucitol operon